MGYLFEEKDILSVTEVIFVANQLLADTVVYFEGEVSRVSNSGRGQIFFEIKDDKSAVTCGIFNGYRYPPFEEGMKVRVTGSLKVWKNSKLSINVIAIELAGEGDVAKAFALLKMRLEKEGLFDANRKRKLPNFPKNIGIISSKEAAGYGDFMKIAYSRNKTINYYFVPTQVQGASAVKGIVAAFEGLQMRDDLDCIVLIRGGGSAEDLATFNDENIARAIFACKIPVITGIGHERDVTIADLVADFRASTPSNVAEILIYDAGEILRSTQIAIKHISKTLGERIMMLKYKVQRLLKQSSDKITQNIVRLKDVDNRVARLHKLLNVSLQRYKSDLLMHMKIIDSQSPMQILEKGYSVLNDQEGNIVKSSKGLKIGQELNVIMQDGKMLTQVNKIYE